MSALAMNSLVSATNQLVSDRGPDTGSEERLVAAAKRGQAEAFAELCMPHAAKIFRVTHRITRNREDAEDALQDSFLSALAHLKDFDGRSSFSTWLTRIAINSALIKLRKSRASREVPMDGPVGERDDWLNYEAPDLNPNPEERYAQRERVKMLDKAVSKLPPITRGIVETLQMQECSMKEAAQILGISVAAGKTRLFRARVTLRKACHRS